jgi:tRNA nucleotidyltransferase (CCA-adding enzyme)
MQMYEVGGCIRDEILGIKSKDIDFSVVMDTVDGIIAADFGMAPFDWMVVKLEEQMGVKIFRDNDGQPIGAEHFTARGQAPKTFPNHPGRALDFVLARKEGEYTDGRRPDSVEVGTLMDDLARRDFTMNAIAKAADGSLIDPFNGVRDIERRLIRAVGDPMERLTEDALRAVRAIRFAQTKGFAIEKSLADAMESDEVLDLVVNKISDERIKQEVSKMFKHNTLSAGHILFGHYMLLTEAIFSGSVSLDATMKTKGRGK